MIQLSRHGRLYHFAYFWMKEKDRPDHTNICALFWRTVFQALGWVGVLFITVMQYVVFSIPAFLFVGHLPRPAWGKSARASGLNLEDPTYLFFIPHWMPQRNGIPLPGVIWLVLGLLGLVGACGFTLYVLAWKILWKWFIVGTCFSSTTNATISISVIVFLAGVIVWFFVWSEEPEWSVVSIKYVKSLKDRACPLVQFVDKSTEKKMVEI